MEEVIKYFEGLEERIATLEAELASLEAEIDELKSRPAPEPQVVEKVVEKIVEKPVEVIKEVVVKKPVVVAAPVVPEKPEAIQEEPAAEEPVKEEPVKEEPVKEDPAPAKEEVASPKAAVYGKAVDDIRQAISLGDRFLYQRELFNQNAELMQKTLTELNELGSFDEAIQYISRFGWDTESNSYQQFIVALHRRFG
ncbi:MAG: hypothetical protein IJ602_00570 [Paludibacteraceae bacterium]|nr:hypothetical protein [Paludibacteraceae bacterium]